MTYLWPFPKSYTYGTNTYGVDAAHFSYDANPSSNDLQLAFQRYLPLTFPHYTTSSAQVYNQYDVVVSSLSVVVQNTSGILQLETDESYSLNINDDGTAELKAETVFGAMHGLETFSQLVHFNFDTQSYEIRNAPWAVQDAPRFPHRGLLIDSSRHYEPVNTIKQVIDSITYAKLNTLHWHIVDEQSFPFDSPSYPLLSRAGAYSNEERYTVDDVADVVEYARQRGIRVMVEIDTPGHARCWCQGYPEICPSSTCLSPLNPATNATFDLIQGLFQDLTGGERGAGLFPENFLHLGGDEVDTTCWTTTPAVANWLAAHNMTADDGYEYFVERVHAIAIAQGRDPVNWEEVFNHFGNKLDKRSIIHIWIPGSKTLPNVTASGYRALYSPDGIWYLDGLDVSWETFYLNEPTEGIPPPQWPLLLGGEVCMWGETVDTSDIQQTIWPRAAAAAERMWSPLVPFLGNTTQALPRLESFRCRLNRRGIAAAPVNNDVARNAPPGPGGCLVQ